MAQKVELAWSLPPHLPGDGDTTLKVMTDVLIALAPATIAGIVFFGVYSAAVVVVSMLTAAIVEALYLRRSFTPRGLIGDGSPLVAGLLLALVVPPSLPLPLVALGSAVAMLVGKHFFGGIGRNIFNPALLGRAFLFVVWPRQMATWTPPLDGTTTATPLGGGEASYLDMFLGTIPGSLGETSALLLLIGAAYLFYRGRIGWRIPASFIAGVVIFAPIFGGDILFHLLAGGVVIGAFYMATDMVTSPVQPTGQILFGLGCGIATMVIRELAGLPEGVMYAILLMNALVPMLDRFFRVKTLGEA